MVKRIYIDVIKYNEQRVDLLANSPTTYRLVVGHMRLFRSWTPLSANLADISTPATNRSDVDQSILATKLKFYSIHGSWIHI